MKVIELHQSVTASNDLDAQKLRNELSERGIMLVNLMSAAGSGKTTILLKTIADLRDRLRIAVMEADIESSVDAEKIVENGGMAIQVHTDGMCHMDAGMTREGLENMDLENVDVAILENIGNLICPAEYDTGAHVKVMILSVPEGDDKPLKYPLMFKESDALLISKTDALPYFSFDMNKVYERVQRLNPKIRIFPVSAKYGDGMAEWEEWLIDKRRELTEGKNYGKTES